MKISDNDKAIIAELESQIKGYQEYIKTLQWGINKIKVSNDPVLMEIAFEVIDADFHGAESLKRMIDKYSQYDYPSFESIDLAIAEMAKRCSRLSTVKMVMWLLKCSLNDAFEYVKSVL